MRWHFVANGDRGRRKGELGESTIGGPPAHLMTECSCRQPILCRPLLTGQGGGKCSSSKGKQEPEDCRPREPFVEALAQTYETVSNPIQCMASRPVCRVFLGWRIANQQKCAIRTSSWAFGENWGKQAKYLGRELKRVCNSTT